MSSNVDWRQYVDELGNFELPNYLFRLNTDLMKETLDLGTLLSDDPVKLRAYKEQIKKCFKNRWLNVAQALDFFEVITACGCKRNDFCDSCGGSRYKLNGFISPDQMREIGIFYGADADAELADKLQKGLVKALREVEQLAMPKV